MLEDRRSVPIIPGVVRTDVAFGELSKETKNSNTIMGDEYYNRRIRESVKKAIEKFEEAKK